MKQKKNDLIEKQLGMVLSDSLTWYHCYLKVMGYEKEHVVNTDKI